MDSVEVTEPPKKKRRFFVDDPPSVQEKSGLQEGLPPTTTDALTSPRTSTETSTVDDKALDSSLTDPSILESGQELAQNEVSGFDKETFESFVGSVLEPSAIQQLREISGGNLERAINMYLDGSWSAVSVSLQNGTPTKPMDAFTARLPARNDPQTGNSEKVQSRNDKSKETVATMPDYRYVGAFGVGAWATRSGAGLVGIGEAVKIERTKIKPPVKVGRGGKVIQPSKVGAARQRSDVIVRFTNAKGEEVGRLPKDTANWVSTLLDQKVCRFEGVCFFAPDRIRVNDTIELQIECSLLRRAFEANGFVKPQDNNRTTGIFEETETSEEKDLRLRQVALVRLFDEINLHPTTVNDTTAKHKREGILQAAEIAEQYDKNKDSKQPESTPNGTADPPNDEQEEGKELEQDQLDSLYKKAQSFDFDTPTKKPAGTFSMDLRKYQQQALHWMMSKERDEKSDDHEASMHPLWEEYSWPIKDMNDEILPDVTGQRSFYVNPYSGELSVEFPAQEQHCLGGLLADEMGESSIQSLMQQHVILTLLRPRENH